MPTPKASPTWTAVRYLMFQNKTSFWCSIYFFSFFLQKKHSFSHAPVGYFQAAIGCKMKLCSHGYLCLLPLCLHRRHSADSILKLAAGGFPPVALRKPLVVAEAEPNPEDMEDSEIEEILSPDHHSSRRGGRRAQTPTPPQRTWTD